MTNDVCAANDLDTDPVNPPADHVRCDTARREKIMSAATRSVVKYGYQATSMDRVAHGSGMSKKTVYRMFSSKQELFETLLQEKLLRKEPQDLPREGKNYADRLTRGICMLADDFLGTERISLLRAVIGELSRHPEIGQFMEKYFATESKTYPMRVWLQELYDQNALKIDDITATADRLFGMTLGVLALGELTQCRPRMPKAERDAFIAESVRIFLYGAGAQLIGGL